MDKSKFGATGMAQSRMSGTATLGQTGTKSQSKMSGVGKDLQVKKPECSSEEEIMSKEIKAVEATCLAKVFDQLRTAGDLARQGGVGMSSKDNFNNSNNNISSNLIKESTVSGGAKKEQQQSQATSDSKDYFTASDLAAIFHEYVDKDNQPSKAEIDQMIWEVDENLDDKVNRYEFDLMYRRCRHDTNGLEPRNLYNLVQFLMYLKSVQNVSSSSSNQAVIQTPEQGKVKKTITVEDTLELLFVRYGRLNLDQEILEIFGKEEKNAQGEEKQITLKEFLDKQRKRDFAQRKELEAQRKLVKIPKDLKDK